MKLALLWDDIEVELPVLAPPLLAPGEMTRVDQGRVGAKMDTYLLVEEKLRFGSYEVENGEDIDPPVPIAGMSVPDLDDDEEEDEDPSAEEQEAAE